MLGIPRQDGVELYRLTEAIHADPASQPEGAGQAAVFEMFSYASGVWNGKRAHPGDDLASALVNAEVDGHRLDETDFSRFFLLLIDAGGDTTLVGTGVSRDDFASDPGKYDLPDSVIGFLRGELGDPPGGWPEPFRTAALAGRRPASPPAPLTDEDRHDLAERPRAALNRLLFPGPTRDFTEHRDIYGDVSLLPTREFLYGLQEGTEYAVDLEPGVRLLLGIQAVSDPDDRGMRTVIGTLNGQLRPVVVRDRGVEATEKTAEKADRSIPGHVPDPFVGTVTLQVSEGSSVTAGQVIATIEAMKMEAAITAPLDGTVARLAINPVQPVEGGDLLLVIS